MRRVAGQQAAVREHLRKRAKLVATGPMGEPPALPLDEAAAELGLCWSEWTLRRLINAGLVLAVEFDGLLMLPVSEVRRLALALRPARKR